MAYIVVAFIRSRRSGSIHTRAAFAMVLAMAILQMALGIMTVLYSAPVVLALTHQLGAVVLWVMILRARFLTQFPRAQSVRG